MTQVKFVDNCCFSNVQNVPDSDVKPNLLAFIPLRLSFEYNDTKLSFLFTLVNNYTGQPIDNRGIDNRRKHNPGLSFNLCLWEAGLALHPRKVSPCLRFHRTQWSTAPLVLDFSLLIPPLADRHKRRLLETIERSF